MKHRTSSRIGRPVSEIGLGCWQIGAEWGPVDEQRALAVLAAAHEAGIDFFDTADVYGQGRSERLIGRFVRETGVRPFVATKLGRFPTPGWPENFAPDSMRAHVEASLERLGVDALDLLQLHCVPHDVLVEGRVFDTLRELVGAGLVRRFGASVESMAEAETCLQHDDLASLQIIFNAFRQKPARVLFDRARAQGVALIVRLPLASGMLSGKFDASTTFAADDHRAFNRDGAAFNVGETFAGLPYDKAVELTEGLRPLLPAHLSMACAAQRWILDHHAVTTVITGASRPEQARENASVSDTPPLSDDVHDALRRYHDERVAPHVRGPD